MHTTSETLYLFFSSLNIFIAGFCIGRSIYMFEKKSKKTEEATSSSPGIRIVNLRCGLCRIAKPHPMSFGTAFNNDFSRGVPVTPRCKRAGSRCKTLGAIRTDKETQNAPRARKAVFARLVKGA